MFKQLFFTILVLCCFSSNALAMKSDNPFAKNENINVGKDISWKIDKETVLATKTAEDGKGNYYHLHFDNKQIRLSITEDAAGLQAKSFSQLEIKNVQIDGKQSSIFKWCLKNQGSHSRFLQQGLTVKKNICSINGGNGTFIMRLNKETLVSLQNASNLSIMLKPFRTPLNINYDISDFKVMQADLNSSSATSAASAAPAVSVAAVATPKAAPKAVKKCNANPPEKYKKIKSIEYVCDDAAAKKSAEAKVAKSVDDEKAKQKKIAAEKEKQRKLAEEKKQEDLALKAEQEKIIAAEAAAIAASEAKQLELNSEITQKMLKVCKKYWDKGEHRCYCEKYIDHAPSSIQASSTCK